MDYSPWGRKESDKTEPLCVSMNFSRGFPSHSRQHQMPKIYSGGSDEVSGSSPGGSREFKAGTESASGKGLFN